MFDSPKTIGYELLDHTADFGIRVQGPGLSELFTKAALAMMDVSVQPGEPRDLNTDSLEIHGFDWPDLMVNWLREVLYRWSGEAKLIRAVAIHQIRPFEIKAEISWQPFFPDKDEIRHEIKAVTYHSIEVCPLAESQTDPSYVPHPSSADHSTLHSWTARVIFDI